MDRCVCLLEMEPRTLNHEELHNAREEAMELHNAWEEAMAIAQNKASVETSNIFTQDMKSVISAKGLDEKALVHKTDHVHELAQVKESWELSSVNSEDHFSTHPPKIKEPLSSPF